MILGSGIQILEGALAKALDEGVTTPTFIEELDVKVFVFSFFGPFFFPRPKVELYVKHS